MNIRRQLPPLARSDKGAHGRNIEGKRAGRTNLLRTLHTRENPVFRAGRLPFALHKAANISPEIPALARCRNPQIAYENVAAFGGNIPNGLVNDRWWYPSFDPAACPGIAGRTPKSLAKYWLEQTGEPLNPAVGLGYMTGQVLLDAIERAGTLDGPTINAAVAKTHLDTIHYSPMVFDENHFARYATALGQWRRTDAPEKWECVLVVAPLPFMGKPENQIFPIPYD